MHPHLSLRASLAAAFALLALIYAGQGGLLLLKLSRIRHDVTEVASNWIPSLVAVTAIRAASEVRIKQMRLLALSDTLGVVSELSRQSEHRTVEVVRFLATVRAA